MTIPIAQDWLSNDGMLLRGKYRDEYASDVVKSDPDYIRWIISEVESCSDDDRETLSALLTFQERGKK